MSSVLRTDVGKAKPFTKFTSVKTPTYYDGNLGHDVLIPFSYKNGVLDIADQDDSMTMINNGDIFNNYGESWRIVKQMGGEGRVTSLGPNFLTWITAYLNYEYTVDSSSISIQVAPVMTRVQQTVSVNGPNQLNSKYAITYGNTDKPSTDQYILDGNDANNYFSVWVFKSPITLNFYDSDGSSVKYISLYTQFTNV